MQYALLIYEDEQVYRSDDADMADVVAQHRAYAAGLGPRFLSGSGLKETDSATTVRTQGGAKTIHDGPFAETKEQLGGFYIVEAPDLDAAIEMARNLPLYRDGSVEIRPLIG